MSLFQGVMHHSHGILTSAGLRWLASARAPTPYTPVAGRVLYVAASALPYHISGYTTRTHEILMALRQYGGDVVPLTRPGYPYDRPDRLCSPATTITRVDDLEYLHSSYPSRNRPLLLYAAQAAKVVARHAVQHKVAVIHAASNHTNALPALIAARRLGIPFQYEMRGLWELTRASRQPKFENSHNFLLGLELEGLTASHADRLFVISEQMARYASQRWNITPERIRLLPNCVDAERMTPLAGQNAEPNSIGYAGSLICYEGLDVLIRAAACLAASGKMIRLEIVGDGEARSQLEALSRELGLEQRVRFWGSLPPEEARAALGRCALCCIPRKPFEVCRIVPPIKLAEAMALGLPVIVPRLPVFLDEVGHNSPALFFNAADEKDLANVINKALENPPELLERGKNCRRYILTHRQWKDHVAQILLESEG